MYREDLIVTGAFALRTEACPEGQVTRREGAGCGGLEVPWRRWLWVGGRGSRERERPRSSSLLCGRGEG